jgi:Gpi18-like mannosyltransferase
LIDDSASSDVPLNSDGNARSFLLLIKLLITALGLGLIVAPWIFQPSDMYECWLPWMRATRGLFPWRAYSVANCNYPPFMLYVWTACQAAERMIPLHGEAKLLLAITLVKLPNLLAYAAGALLCSRCLRSLIGETAANSIAFAYALCLPVWFNAALWGQCDAMLSLAMLAAIIALMSGRPAIAGACVGWALAIKLQAVVIVPVMIVYAGRRLGIHAALKAILTAVAMMGVFLLPMIIAGYGQSVRLSYFGAVGLYPYLSIGALNPWALVSLFEICASHLPGNIATSDGQLWLGFTTPRQIGFVAFACFTLWVMLALYRRPTRFNAALSAGLMAYGFFMLSTQMHERYVIPAAALLTLCCGRGGLRIYLAVMIPASLNQIKGLAGPLLNSHFDATMVQRIMNGITLPLATLNLCLFVWVCMQARRRFKSDID